MRERCPRYAQALEATAAAYGYADGYATKSIAAKGAPARRPPPPHPRSRPAGRAGHPYDLARAPRRRRSRRRPHRLALQLSTSTRPHYADAPGPAARGQPCWPPSPSPSPDARAAAPAPQAGCPAGHATTASCCCPVSNQGGNVGIAEGVATGTATGMAGLCGVLSVQLVGRSPSTRPPSSATYCGLRMPYTCFPGRRYVMLPATGKGC